MSEYARTYPSEQASNPAALLNGFTTVQPWESWQIDQHPDAQRIWATIATYQCEAYGDGEDMSASDMLEAADDLSERVRSETLDEVLSVLRRLNLCVLNDEFVTDRFAQGELADYENILQFLEESRV